MKNVFSNSDLCHTFAQRTQERGKSSNMFFEHDKIYSYGYHYLLAEFLPDDSILINDNGYSNTTAKHISKIRQATRQYKQYFTTSCDLDIVYRKINDLSKKLLTARKKDIYANEIISLFDSCLEFNLKYRVNQLHTDKFKAIELIYNNISKNIDEYIKQGKEREIKENEKLIIKLAEDVKKFNNYEINYINSRNLNIDYIRISKDNNFIESSQGVKIDIDLAKRLYNKIALKEDIRGYNIGGYTVTGLNGVLSIGCHKIDVSNVHEIGLKIIS